MGGTDVAQGVAAARRQEGEETVQGGASCGEVEDAPTRRRVE